MGQNYDNMENARLVSTHSGWESPSVVVDGRYRIARLPSMSTTGHLVLSWERGNSTQWGATIQFTSCEEAEGGSNELVVTGNTGFAFVQLVEEAGESFIELVSDSAFDMKADQFSILSHSISHDSVKPIELIGGDIVTTGSIRTTVIGRTQAAGKVRDHDDDGGDFEVDELFSYKGHMFRANAAFTAVPDKAPVLTMRAESLGSGMYNEGTVDIHAGMDSEYIQLCNVPARSSGTFEISTTLAGNNSVVVGNYATSYNSASIQAMVTQEQPHTYAVRLYQDGANGMYRLYFVYGSQPDVVGPIQISCTVTGTTENPFDQKAVPVAMQALLAPVGVQQASANLYGYGKEAWATSATVEGATGSKAGGLKYRLDAKNLFLSFDGTNP